MRPLPASTTGSWRVLAAACGLLAVAGAPWPHQVPAAQTQVADSDLEQASAGRSVVVGPTAGGKPTTIPLEVYVARVIAGEGEPRAPEATQQALAIAIRTYATVNAGRHASQGFDLCDGTHCQVPRAATPASRTAALATAGRVVTYNGSVAEVFYSASCGGHSESAEDVWPGVKLPYLKSIVDDVHADDVPWKLERSLGEIQRALVAAGFGGSRLRNVSVEERSGSGRALRLGVDGLRPDTISGDAFRAAVGTTTLRSTAFTIDRRGDAITFTGRGYGHGVGMCVIGAGRRARRGETAEQILKAYYPGVELRDVTALVAGGRSKSKGAVASIDVAAPVVGAAGATPASVTTAPTAAAPATAATPRPVENAALVPPRSAPPASPAGTGLVRDLDARAAAARTAVASVLGVVPEGVSIEIYDTIEAFRTATGRPWWVAFDQRISSIALGPTVLADTATLDAALTAAIAQRVMTPVLSDRPLWVRVGGARYMARVAGLKGGASPPVALAAQTTDPRPSRDACPADAELTLAVSAAAQRDAEARAEACFARALQAAGDWRTVRP
jgi:SpoIID/LytB domain protein